MGNGEGNIVSIFHSECLEQPRRLRDLFLAYAHDPEIRGEMARSKEFIRLGEPLVWTGMGASYCSALSGASLLSSWGHPSFVVEASEWLHYALPTWGRVAGPILVTTTGESAELVELCHVEPGLTKIFVSNNTQSR